MGFYDSIGKFVVVSLIIIGALAYFGIIDFDAHESKPSSIKTGPANVETRVDSELEKALPFINKIAFDDVELRSFTTKVTKGCPSGDKECQLNKVFRYVVENYDYYSDPRNKELIQSPYETIDIEGGDCEDLSILMNSMLENIGFKTYLVLTDGHAYSLVCGVDPSDLREYVDDSILKKYADDYSDEEGDIVYEDGKIFLKHSYVKNFVVGALSTYYFGGEGDMIEDPFISQKLDYEISFSSPVDFYVLGGKGDYELLSKGLTFKTYSKCTELNVLRVIDSCEIATEGGIAISNNKLFQGTSVDMKLDVYYLLSSYDLLKDRTITSYNIDGDTCVVLDATVGDYGYAGYNPKDIAGDKIAIDPITKEVIRLA